MITRVCIKDKPTPAYDIYIGRANKWLELPQSKWHNPFVMKNESDRERVLILFEEYLLNSPELIADLHELDDKVLGCCCKENKKCHGDILKKFRERQLEKSE